MGIPDIRHAMGHWRYILEQLPSFGTLDELRRSAFFAERGGEIEAALRTPEITACENATPRLRSFVRVAQWNIEKGKRCGRVLECLQTDATLKWADVILLNEADRGMVRSGNVHVAFEIASALGMNMAFGPAHIELTKGTDDELRLEGENLESLQGNAVLSRFPILEARVIPLPVCFEPFEFHEKRYGRRNCIWARLKIGQRTAWVGAAHLEVRNTPRCRAVQMRHLMSSLPGPDSEPHLLGGDLNSNGFPRGSRWRALRSVERLAFHDAESVKEELRHPERRLEPLFPVARRAGFDWQGLNSFVETASAPLGNLEDADFLPGPLVRCLRRRLEPYHGILPFKLDWLLGRGVRALGEREIVDSESSVASSIPGCIPTERSGPARISDHSPIFADILL